MCCVQVFGACARDTGDGARARARGRGDGLPRRGQVPYRTAPHSIPYLSSSSPYLCPYLFLAVARYRTVPPCSSALYPGPFY